ncbi:uncharacterized protein ACRADG_005297 [Cochliomyia hominivorax]
MKFQKKRPRSTDLNTFPNNKTVSNHKLIRIYCEQPTFYNIRATVVTPAAGKHVNNKGRHLETMTTTSSNYSNRSHNKKSCYKSHENVFAEGATDTYNCCCSNNNYEKQHLPTSPPTPKRREFLMPPLVSEGFKRDLWRKFKFYKEKVLRNKDL